MPHFRSNGRCNELRLELLVRAKVALDHFCQITLRLTTLARNACPVNRVQDVAGQLIGQFLGMELHQREVAGLACPGEPLLCLVRCCGGGLVMEVVVEFHRAGINDRLERIKGKRQW